MNILPSDAETECAALAAALYSADAAAVVADSLTPEHFFTYRPIFTAIVDLLTSGAPIEPVAVKAQLDLAGSPGSADLLINVMGMYVGSASAGYYVDRLKQLHRRRQLIMVGGRLTQLGETDGLDADQVESRADALIAGIADIGHTDTAQPVSELALPHLDWLESTEADPTLSTGFVDLDHILGGGLKPGQLVVVAARPGGGKSVALLNVARHVGITLAERTLFVSLEMPRRELMNRLLAQVAQVSLSTLENRAELAKDDRAWSRIAAHSAKLQAAENLIIEADPRFGVAQARGFLSRAARIGRPLRLLVIDYVQLMRGSGKPENRLQELTAITKTLKQIAIEFDLPVLVAAQLNRGPEQRTDKRPQKSDLRESGSLENDADVVILLHRPDMHDPESPRIGEADFIVDKNRQGATATVAVAFQGHYSRFTDMATLPAPN
jgi:replicative DNA helicase